MIEIFSNILYPNAKLIDKSKNRTIDRILKELPEYGMSDLEARASFYELYSIKEIEILYNDIYKRLCSKDEKVILDAVSAVSILSENEQIDINYLVECVSQSIRCRTKVLDRFIDLMIILLRNNPNLLTTNILNNVEIGLNYLTFELVIDNDDTDEKVHYKLLCLKKIACFLSKLKIFYESKKREIPDFIIQWEEICLEENNFAEIRNAWING